MAEEYEIVPEKEVEDLKKQIEDIKKNPFGAAPAGRELIRAIQDLNDSVNHLIGLFRDAADAMKLEEKESEAIGNKLAPMLSKLDMLIDQNEKIARGIVGVADMVKEDMKKKPAQSPQFTSRPIPPPISERPSPPPMNPPPRAPTGPPPMNFPPEPKGPMGPRAPQGMGPGAMPPPPAAPKEKPKKRLFGF